MSTFISAGLQCFPPVVDADTHTLVLGSLPGVASLSAAQYYAHPRNQFWDLLGEVIGTPLRPLPYVMRLETLQRHGVGLWDVIAQAERKGSLDSNIRDHAGNDLCTLIRTLPNLRTIGFNGGTAAKLGERALGALAQHYRIVRLPSSSPAYAAMRYEDKLAVWTDLALKA